MIQLRSITKWRDEMSQSDYVTDESTDKVANFKVIITGIVVALVIAAIYIKLNPSSKLEKDLTYISFQDYQSKLNSQQQKLRALLDKSDSKEVSTTGQDITRLNILLQNNQQQLNSPEQSYKERVKELEEQVKLLEKVKGTGDDALLQQAQLHIAKDDSDIADEKLSQIDLQSAGVQAAAAISYQRGTIAYHKVLYSQAFNFYKHAVQIEPSNLLYLHSAGFLANRLAKYNQAIEYYGKILTVTLQEYGKKNHNTATANNNLGDIWKSLGNNMKAIDHYEQALAIVLNVYGEGHPSIVRTQNNLGAAWYLQGDYKKAIEYYELALEIDLAVYGEKHPSVARDRNNIGTVWKARGEYKKAAEYLESALMIVEEVLGVDHPGTKTVRKNLHNVQQKL